MRLCRCREQVCTHLTVYLDTKKAKRNNASVTKGKSLGKATGGRIAWWQKHLVIAAIVSGWS